MTLIPTYVIFTWLGWNGTWLPLIIPHFFANAYNVFLLRQYFMSIPRELDEAAMIDGAGPVPDPALDHRPAVASRRSPRSRLFHFFFAWNDFFVPLLYLASKPDLQPLSIAIQQYNALYSTAADAHPGGRPHDDGRPDRRSSCSPNGRSCAASSSRASTSDRIELERGGVAADEGSAGSRAAAWPVIPASPGGAASASRATRSATAASTSR